MNVNTITYNKQFIETSGSDLVLNVDSFNEFEILLKNNITLSLSNINGNKKITIWLIQDGTGSRTVTFSSQFTFTTVNVNTVTSTANATTVQKFDINSGKVYCSYTSNAAGGGSWGDLTGTLSDQTDLQSALDDKEDSLGNPSVDDYVLSSKIDGTRSWVAAESGSGTVTSVSVVTANGVSGSVADETTTPAITLTLGHIVPNSATITPLDDRQALTIRRNSAGQTNHILDVQTEANGQLAYIDKDGNLFATNIDPLIPRTDVNFNPATGVQLDRSGGTWYNLYVQSGALELIIEAGSIVSGGAVLPITVDGNTVTITGAVIDPKSDTPDTTSGHKDRYSLWKDEMGIWYSITNLGA